MTAVQCFRSAVILMSVVVANHASAQVTYHLSLQPGTEVRVQTRQQPHDRITGEVYGVARDTLSIRRDGQLLNYAISDLRRLEIRSGIDRKRGMLIGAGIGGAIGFLEGPEQRFSVTVGTALIGTLVGYAFAPKGWERIPIPAGR